ncbi:MAG TPA: PAS domain S-box protein [Candidatus Ozemobacteraceae bacterium]
MPVERFAWWMDRLTADSGVIRIPDTGTLPEAAMKEILLQPEACSVLLATVPQGGEVHGFIGLETTGQLLDWPDSDAIMLQTIARLIGGVYERLEQTKALSTRSRQQAAIAELGRIALGGVGISELMEHVVRNIALFLNVELAKVLELLPDRSGFLLRAGVGWKEGLVGTAIIHAGKDSQAGFTLLEKDPVIVEDLGTETRFSGPPLLFDHGVISGLSVIIGSPDQPYGVLGAHTRQRRRFTLEEVHFLQGVAHLLAVTLQRRAIEAELRENRRFFADLVEHSGALIFAKDRAGRYILVNRRWEDVTRLSREQTIGHTDEQLFQVADAAQFRHNDLEVMDSGQARESEERLDTPRGQRYFLSIKFPLRNNAGEVTGVCGMATEITDRRNVIEALRRSEERLRALIEGAPDAIMVQTRGVFTFLNPEALRLFGAADPESILGTPVVERFHPIFREQVLARIKTLNEAHQPVPLAEEIILRLDGTSVPVEVSAVPFHYEDDDGSLVFLRDITERKKAEEDREKILTQLSQATKMESIGRLAGGVAHDFNNMLGVILGRADMALETLTPASPLWEDLHEIRQTASHSADLTRQLLAFARKQTTFPQILDLNVTIGSMLKMIRRLIGEDIELQWSPGETSWKVCIDPGQVDQILANLCVNARDAITGHGRITIQTTQTVLRSTETANHPEVSPGEFVEIRVSDTGMGMDRSTLAHLFEPFFTTKEVGKGTGLGLATVYGIVRQNEGCIFVESKPNEGTLFRILLPRHREASEAASHAAPTLPPLRGGETILLVEDELPLLKLIRKMLAGAGYQVLEAQTPTEALRIAHSHTGTVDLLLTDVIMPEMNGRVLANQIQSVFPNIRRVFMSGYTADVIARQGILDEGAFFLQKPFSPKMLTETIREALQAPDK